MPTLKKQGITPYIIQFVPHRNFSFVIVPYLLNAHISIRKDLGRVTRI